MAGSVSPALLGILQTTARLPAGSHAGAGGAVARAIRRTVFHSDGLRRTGSADRPNSGRQNVPADGAGSSRDPAAQQPGRTGRADTSQEESGKLRSALAGWRPDLGRNGNTAQHRQETGSELLSIHPRPGQRSDADALPGGPDQATSRNHESQFFVEAHVTVPGLLRRYKGSVFEILYRRLAPRRGHFKAIWAVAHRLCRIVWKILHEGVDYEERGYRTNPHAVQKRTNRLVRELRRLGYQVQLTSSKAGAPA